MINFNALTHDVAWIGCAFLFVWWLLVSRKWTGFLLTVTGWVVILVVVYSDHKPAHMAGLLVCAALIMGLLLAGSAVVMARKRRVAVYVPVDLRRTPDEVTRLVDRAAPEARRGVADVQHAQRRPRNNRARIERARKSGRYVVNRGMARR
jgi:hypothetical protein